VLFEGLRCAAAQVTDDANDDSADLVSFVLLQVLLDERDQGQNIPLETFVQVCDHGSNSKVAVFVRDGLGDLQGHQEGLHDAIRKVIRLSETRIILQQLDGAAEKKKTKEQVSASTLIGLQGLCVRGANEDGPFVPTPPRSLYFYAPQC
jgi:hypothetical protein